jgi:ABC-type transport system involved in cytochrome c biogenesis permease subunit
MMGRLMPWVGVAAAVALLVRAAAPASPSADGMRIEEFGAIVMAQGRVKPADTIARTSLLAIAGRQSFRDADGERRPAIRWLLDVMVSRYDVDLSEADKRKVFEIEDPALLRRLGLQPRASRRYALEEFSEPLGGMVDRAREAFNRVRRNEATAEERALARLMEQALMYRNALEPLAAPHRAARHAVFKIQNPQVLDRLGLAPREGYRYALSEFADHVVELMWRAQEIEQRRKAGAAPDAFERQWTELANHVHLYGNLLQWSVPHAVPPAGEDEEWETLRDASEHKHAEAADLEKILKAYAAGNAAGFNEATGAYRASLKTRLPVESAKSRFEVFFNRFDPFWQCAVLYLAAFVLTALGWLGWAKPLSRSAFWLISVTLAVHTAGLVARIWLSGRPPVTNLYGSAVFIGWACVGLGLILEIVFRIGVGNAIAALAGFATLLIADRLSTDGDTMEVLQAVLDTQFWLATHVVCITLGYATTYVAGLIANLHILRGVLTRSLTPDVSRAMTRMTYGAICFATFFSFVGTVLGGLWADDSWGRFWGWDPKENGALMIVLWNVLVLHARWGGMARDRGIAVLAVFGTVITSWSWFGVNLLGVGLHSYGFTEGPRLWLGLFAASQLAVMGLGMLPARMRGSKAWDSEARLA